MKERIATGTNSKRTPFDCCGWALKVMQNTKYNIHLKMCNQGNLWIREFSFIKLIIKIILKLTTRCHCSLTSICLQWKQWIVISSQIYSQHYNKEKSQHVQHVASISLFKLLHSTEMLFSCKNVTDVSEMHAHASAACLLISNLQPQV